MDVIGILRFFKAFGEASRAHADRHLWIAKFTSARDTKPVERVEVATLKLAAICGLRVAEAKLEMRVSDSPIALIRRFDCPGNRWIPVITALSELDWDSDKGGFYTDIADVFRQISSKSVDDLHELWRRIVFTILASNKDDHLKNYSFIYAGGDRSRLSPAFDINPSPSRLLVLETGIMQDGPPSMLDHCRTTSAHRCHQGTVTPPRSVITQTNQSQSVGGRASLHQNFATRFRKTPELS